MEAIDTIVTEFMVSHPAIKTVLGLLTTLLVVGKGRAWYSKKPGL